MKLSDILGTVYLTVDYKEELEHMFSKISSCIGHGTKYTDKIYNTTLSNFIVDSIDKRIIELDFADIRMCTGVYDLIDSFMRRNINLTYFTDSQDSERDRYFQECRYTLTHPVKTVSLPQIPNSLEVLRSYIRNLNADLIYQGDTSELQRVVLALTTLVRPEIKFTFQSWTEFFKYMHHKCAHILYKYDNFYYLPVGYGNYWDTKVERDGTVYVLNVGYISKEKFLDSYICLPTCLGTVERMYKSDSDWYDITMEIMKDFTALKVPDPILLRDYFEEFRR